MNFSQACMVAVTAMHSAGWPRTAAGQSDELEPGRVIAVHVSAAVDLSFASPASGRAVARAASVAIDPRIEIEDVDGQVIARDEDGGGPTTALVSFPAAEGAWYTVRVCSEDGRAGEARVSIVVLLDVEGELSERQERAAQLLQGARRAQSRAAWPECREHLKTLADLLLDIPMGQRPLAAQELLWQAANVATEVRDLDQGVRLFEAVLAQDVLFLREDDQRLAKTRGNLANLHAMRGEPHKAEPIMAAVVEQFAASRKDNDPDLIAARANLALVRKALGDFDGARSIFEALLPLSAGGADRSSEAQVTYNLASLWQELGQPKRALPLFERAVSLYGELPPAFQAERVAAALGLAAARRSLGDAASAINTLFALEADLAHRVTADDLLLAAIRHNLAYVLMTQQRLEEAQKLQDAACGAFARQAPGHQQRLEADLMRATIDAANGDYARAEDGQRQILALADQHGYGNFHPTRLTAMQHMAETRALRGDIEGALALTEELCSRAKASGNGTVAHQVQADRALYLARLGRHEQLAVALRELGIVSRSQLEGWTASLAPREIEANAVETQKAISRFLSLRPLCGPNALEEDAFVLTESARAAAATAHRVVQQLQVQANQDQLAKARRDLARATREVRRAAQGGDASLLEAIEQRDLAARELARLVPIQALCDPQPKAIAAALRENEAGIAYWRYTTQGVGKDDWRTAGPARYAAWVVRRKLPLRMVELGPAEAIDDAVARWRAAVGAPLMRGAKPFADDDDASVGARLLDLVMAPILADLNDVERLIVVPDGSLHLVPLDALPIHDGLLGDRYEVDLRPSLKELTLPTRRELAPMSLLAVGGVDYDLAPEPNVQALQLRGIHGPTWDRAFTALPSSREEVQGIATYFEKVFRESQAPSLLLDRAGTLEAFLRLAPGYRFLHLATHAYFAPESIASQSGDRFAAAGTDPQNIVTGLAPLILCGVAFAGANRAALPDGTLPGLLSAEEISSCDLSRCELMVLSACQTNVGILRAGQGIASLREAVHAAGVRTAITSLWAVPDEATRLLMTDFYRRFWVMNRSKGRSLWEAKRALSRRLDAAGQPVYEQWQWAGWVLSGDA